MADRTRSRPGYDVLQLPLLGRLLKMKRGRLWLQLPMLIVSVLLVIDGLTGPQNAARNLATVAPWVHYRGLVVLALLLAGNLFCMACPFTVPRTLARRLSIRGRRFPRPLRNKWIAIASLFILFFLYEYLDLWASPALTAWVIVVYFVASFVMEAVFTESAFCKYVCPIGTFNFTYSTLSPTKIGVRDSSLCASCVGKECVNGSYAPQSFVRVDSIPLAGRETVSHGPEGVLGCGTLLFPPQMKSSLDCTLCLDCVRACPYENASLLTRSPGQELREGSWPKRWDISLMVITLAFMGVTNAFGMVPPIYELMANLVNAFGFTSELPVLLLIFVTGNLLLPVVLTLLAARLSRSLTASRLSLRETVAAFAPAFVPLGFGVWFAHYSFHFLIAPGTIIPVIQEFLGQTGDWATFGVALDSNFISLIQVAALAGSFLWSMVLAQQAALRLYGRRGMSGFMPWALLLLVVMLTALWIMSLPMEMRGTEFMFS